MMILIIQIVKEIRLLTLAKVDMPNVFGSTTHATGQERTHEQNEYRTKVRAPLSHKMRTARRQEHQRVPAVRRVEKNIWFLQVKCTWGAPRLDGRAMRGPKCCK